MLKWVTFDRVSPSSIPLSLASILKIVSAGATRSLSVFYFVISLAFLKTTFTVRQVTWRVELITLPS